jgi:hypothetical protein
MKPGSVTRSTLIPLSLVLVVCKAVWHQSATDKQVEFNTLAVASISNKMDQLLEMKTDIAVIRTKVQAMERPVYHTNQNVKALQREVSLLSPGLYAPLYSVPLTMSTYKR